MSILELELDDVADSVLSSIGGVIAANAASDDEILLNLLMLLMGNYETD